MSSTFESAQKHFHWSIRLGMTWCSVCVTTTNSYQLVVVKFSRKMSAFVSNERKRYVVSAEYLTQSILREPGCRQDRPAYFWLS